VAGVLTLGVYHDSGEADATWKYAGTAVLGLRGPVLVHEIV